MSVDESVNKLNKLLKNTSKEIKVNQGQLKFVIGCYQPKSKTEIYKIISREPLPKGMSQYC